jgi:hypothetical protein
MIHVRCLRSAAGDRRECCCMHLSYGCNCGCPDLRFFLVWSPRGSLAEQGGRNLVVPRSRTRPATLDRAPSGPLGAKTALRLLLANFVAWPLRSELLVPVFAKGRWWAA